VYTILEALEYQKHMLNWVISTQSTTHYILQQGYHISFTKKEDTFHLLNIKQHISVEKVKRGHIHSQNFIA